MPYFILLFLYNALKLAHQLTDYLVWQMVGYTWIRTLAVLKYYSVLAYLSCRETSITLKCSCSYAFKKLNNLYSACQTVLRELI